jgi:F-type H+-transporting ATPase subunit gamma
MPTLKEYSIKLARLRSTRKMTRTMKMVSTNKLRKAQESRRIAAEFCERLDAMARVLWSGGEVNHPLTERRRPVKRVHCLVVTSDRGLCGGYNGNVNRAVTLWLAEHRHRWPHVQLSFCGRRGFLFFKSVADPRFHYEGVSAKPAFAAVRRVGAELQRLFLSGACDEVYVAHTEPTGALSQAPAIRRLLPLDTPPPAAAPVASAVDSLLDPDRAGVLDALLPQWVNAKLYVALLSSSVAEHRARMTAMDNSTRNAETLIDSYTLLRNRARQAAITRELTEIVAGAEALV